MRFSFSHLLLTLLGLFGSACLAETRTVQLTVESKVALEHAPARVQLAVPQALANGACMLKDSAGKEITGQLANPALLANPSVIAAGEVARELVFIVPALKAGETLSLTATISDGPPPAGFSWSETPNESLDLKFGERPVLKYMNKKFDDSTPQNRDLTMKVFHHLYDAKGVRLVTKGAGGEFPHHRGIYYGFMKCSYKGGTGADTWHGRNAHQEHGGVVNSDAGPVLGRHRVIVNWHGKDKAVIFAKEERELTVYNVPGGQLVEFASRLKGTDGTIAVDGDPQHAGFQFRADNEVATTTKNETYYVRPDGIGKKGETRNWSEKTPAHKDLAWNAMSFVIGGTRYTCAYLDKPTNPKEARYSERPYGRFGSYFAKEIPEGESLDVNYRLWLQEGEMTVEDVAAKSAAFVDAPVVKVMK